MPDGREQCPKCEKPTLPMIPPESMARAVACQNPDCGVTIEARHLPASKFPIQPDGSCWRTQCACGWDSKPWPTLQEARIDLNEHILTDGKRQ